MAVVEGGPYFLGRLQAASMMMPAKQGFEADDVAVAKVDLCLIEWEDPVVAEGLARLAQHGFSAFCSLAHFGAKFADDRSEEHTSELQSLMRISYAVFCLKKKNNKQK